MRAARNSAIACWTGVCVVNVTNWCTTQLRSQRCRRHDVTDLPAGHVIGLAERADDEAAGGELGMARHALVPGAVEDDVLVDLVADDEDAGAADDVGQRARCRPR